MAIYGIGTDIVDITRIAMLWQRHGLRLAKHILAAEELIALQEMFPVAEQKVSEPAIQSEFANNPARYIAKRFAIKEAVAKALGTGFRGQVFLTNIFITHDNAGKPKLQFARATQDFVNSVAANVSAKLNFHISVADEARYVVAYAIVELN